VVESIIKPLRPKGEHWMRWPTPRAMQRSGYPCEVWFNGVRALQVLSAVEVAVDRDGSSNGPEYHISISRCALGLEGPQRCTSGEAKWVLREFELEGAEEDNHVPNGKVRNFWRPVAEGLVGKECECKAEEPVIREDKGDYVWRP
jgi:hypothetical protein